MRGVVGRTGHSREGLGDIGREQYRYRERKVLGEEGAKTPKGNNTVRRRKQYGKTKSGRRIRAHT